MCCYLQQNLQIEDSNFAQFGEVINYSKFLLSGFRHVSLNHVKRCNNVVAYFLARKAKSLI